MENNIVNRPVTAADIAARLNMSVHTVRIAMGKYATRVQLLPKTIKLIRETATQMGYNPKAAQGYYGSHANHPRRYEGNFESKEKEVARMKELRELGFSNAEIAKKIGKGYKVVLHDLGKQDRELTRQNVAMGQHIRAQKNAARRQYVVNKPILEHNARVEAANKKKNELLAMQAELTAMQEIIKAEQPAIEQAAQTKIDFPLFDLSTVQPTALQ